MEWVTSSAVTDSSDERCCADKPNLSHFSQKVFNLVHFAGYSQWNVTVHVCVIGVKENLLFLTRCGCKSCLGWGLCLLLGLWLCWKSCGRLGGCSVLCQPAMMFSQFSKIILIINGESWVRAQPQIPEFKRNLPLPLCWAPHAAPIFHSLLISSVGTRGNHVTRRET